MARDQMVGNMTAYFVAFHTDLKPEQLAHRRRRLAELLKNQNIELQTMPLGDGKTMRG